VRVLQWVASAEVSRRGFSTTVRTWSGDIGKTPSRALDGARMDIEASGDGVVRAAFLGAQQDAGVGERASRRDTLAQHSLQAGPLVCRQIDQVLLLHSVLRYRREARRPQKFHQSSVVQD
jgi:hypothetical protein